MRDHGPPLPVVLGEPVLDADDGILVAQPDAVLDHLLATELLSLAGQVVRAAFVELRGGRVQGERYLIPQRVPAPIDGLGDERERRAVVLEVRREPPLVPDATRESPLAEQLLQALIDLGDGAQSLLEAVE